MFRLNIGYGRGRNDRKTMGQVTPIPPLILPGSGIFGLPALRWFFAVMTLIYVVVTPPFQAPDEDFHFFKAYQVSLGGVISIAAEGSLGYILPAAIADLADRRFPPQRDPVIRMRFDPAAVLEAAQDHSNLGASVFVPFPNMAPYAPTMYLPQALGILLARKAGLPPIGIFYAGRVANAMAGIALVLLAVTLIPCGKAALLAFALMPTTLAQFGSLSADAGIIAFGFFTIALAMRAAVGQPLGRWEAWATPPAIAVLALAKGVYWPIAAAGMPSRHGRFGPRQWLITGSTALGVACFLAWVLLGRGAEIQFSIVSRRTLEQTLTARPAEQLAVVFGAPLNYLLTLAFSFGERLPVYVIQVIGRFGWNMILLPLPLYGFGLLLVGLATLAPWSDTPRPTLRQRAWWLVIVTGLIAVVETALYLTGTPLGADYIQGTQGRYFLPFLPLLILALAVPRSGQTGKVIAVCFPLVAVALNLGAMAVAVDAFWIRGFVRGHGF